MMDDNIGDYTYENWIVQLKNTPRISDQLTFILTILNSLDVKIQKDFQDYMSRFEGYFKNQSLMRQIKHRDSLISEYPSEYYGRDYGDDDPFEYKEEIEFKITTISLEIISCLGFVIKKIKSQEFMIDDDV